MKRKNSLGELILGFLIVGINFGVGLGFTIYAIINAEGSIKDIIIMLIFSPLTAYTILFGVLLIFFIVNNILSIFDKPKEKIMIVKKK